MLADLDELVMKCRDERAKKYIDEAVRCYRSGAYRAAVVATWIAVCFDIVDKLRELAGAGDLQADAKAKEVAKHVASNDIAASLKFEAGIPELALEFEFVSNTEKIDLERLKVDRNRCAHPTQNNDAEVFEVPSELARLHIRNAVCHLLQHEPAQGKAVLERLWNDIESASFPLTSEKVLDRLNAGPLRRARQALIRNFIQIAIKKVFVEKPEYKQRNKLNLVLLASRTMHPDEWERSVKEQFGKISERAVDDAALIAFVRAFDKPNLVLWDFLTPVQQERLKNFILHAPSEVFDQLTLLEDKLFEDVVNKRYAKATRAEIMNGGFFMLPSILQVRLAEYLEYSPSFAEANKIFQYINTNASDFTPDSVGKMVHFASKNRQAYDASGFSSLIQKLATIPEIGKEFLDKKLRENGLAAIAEATGLDIPF